jgi:outer membrane protein TolC
LLAAQGQPAPFQPIENTVIPFLREREQQTSVTLTQPLYDARIAANRSAAEYRLRGAEDGLDAFHHQLARDVRQGYFRWLGTREQVVILDASLEAARENQRVNESLFRAGRITRDLVYRAEADVLELEQARLATQNGVRLAQAYVNLLRSAPFDAPLPAASVTDADVSQLGLALARATGQGRLEFEPLQAVALEQRPELRQLDAAAGEAQAGERAARAAFKPQLGLVVDAGSQGEDFTYGTDDRYVLASAVLRFNLSNGGADRAALREALAVSDQVRATRSLAQQRIGLEVLEALQNLEVSQASLATAGKRVVAAEGAFRIASRKRDLGQLGMAEFIDVRRALTEAHQSQNRARTAALGSLAALEYAVGQRPRAVVENAP